MRKNNSLLIVSEDNLITRIIKSLKKFLKIKEDKEEIYNRTAVVLTTEKIERNIRENISLENLKKVEDKVLKDISYIDKLNEDELDSLDDYYDIRISELEAILNDKKSKYYKLVSSR